MTDYFAYLFSLEFQWPWMLLLLPAPWLVNYKNSSAQTETIAPMMPLFDTAKQLGLSNTREQVRHSKMRSIALLVAWICIVMALMRPTHIGDQIDIPLSGRDLMLAIDISPSMHEKDMVMGNFTKTRLDAVKEVVEGFLEEREGDRVGLILFGSEPYIQAPLTFDTTTVNTLLQESFLGMAGQATAIGDAIALGVKRLRQRPEQSRVLVLLSDGANTAGEIPPEKAAKLAAKEQIKTYTIGIGADEMLKRSFFRTQKVNPSADLDEEMLTQIAELTGGEYFRARNKADLAKIYDAINELEPVEQETRSYRPTKSLYYWFVSAALIIYLSLILNKLISRLLGNKLPKSQNTVKQNTANPKGFN